MQSNLGANMNEDYTPTRGERVRGTSDNPTAAWRGREGTFRYGGWGQGSYILWDGNTRTAFCYNRYLEPAIKHREW